MSKGAPNVRYAEVDRESAHSKIHLVLDFDGGSRRDVATGIGTLDQCLIELARYACIDIGVSVESDSSASDHQIVEEVGSSFGRAVRIALEDSDPVVGVGHCVLPSGASLVLCAVDVSSRSCLGWDVQFRRDWIGALATESIREFFNSMAMDGSICLHLHKLAGENDNHTCEALFRSFGRSLFMATRRSDKHIGG